MATKSEIAEKALSLAEACVRSGKPQLEAVAGDDLQALIGAAAHLRGQRRDGDAKTAAHVAYSLVAMTFENARSRLEADARSGR